MSMTQPAPARHAGAAATVCWGPSGGWAPRATSCTRRAAPALRPFGARSVSSVGTSQGAGLPIRVEARSHVEREDPQRPDEPRRERRDPERARGRAGRRLLRPRRAGCLLRPGRRDRLLRRRDGALLRARDGRLLRLRTMTGSAAAPAPPPWESLRAELLRVVRGRIGDPAAADDIVHDVLLRALAELEGPEPPVHLRGWLYRVTRNAIVDHYRARRPSEELPAELEAAGAEQEASAERDLAGCLAPLLARLPDESREALTLAEVDGLAQREIAARAGLSLSGAKSRVQRARRMLRSALLDCCRVEVDRRGGVVAFERRPGGEPCVSPAVTPPAPEPETSVGCGCRSCRPRA